ncbi:MAG: flagellar basal body-associated FliL family protein [Hyphomonadaceae bacterium]|nr:flagellar basal body-associated FliL family protein [Hyphomonadaceae bacterium]
MAKKEKPKKEEEPTDAPAGAEGEEGGEGKPKKKLSGKNLILFIVLPAVLVLAAGGGAAYMLLAKPTGEQHAEAEAGGHGKAKGGNGEAGAEGEPIPGPNGTTISYGEGVVYVGLPELLVNIAGADGRPAYLKLKVTLEAPDQEAVDAITPVIPRVSDQFNAFLRELRTDDLSGSAGAYRLRLELLRRVNLVIAPSRINAVLIEEMLVQ